MKNPHTEHDPSARKRSYRSLWIGTAAIFVLPVLLYYGYCWGLWGRQSLLLQYLFQCNCPAISQEARYPQRVDVIVSACSQPYVKVSPSGRLLYVREEISEPPTIYLLDLQTKQKLEGSAGPISSFLTDDLWFLERDKVIIDRITGARYPIQKFMYSRPDARINGGTNLPLLAESLRQAGQVFLIGPSTDTVVALAADFPAHLERNFIADRFDLPGSGAKRTERFLQENNIHYITVLPDFPHEVVSPDGRLVARPDGIYVVETGEKIVEGFSASRSFRSHSGNYFTPRGWLHDGSGVMYSKFLNPCLIEFNFFSDSAGCTYEVPQPAILLKVPAAY